MQRLKWKISESGLDESKNKNRTKVQQNRAEPYT